MTYTSRSILSKVYQKVTRRITTREQQHEAGTKPFRDIPGPTALPLIGSTWKYFLPLPGKPTIISKKNTRLCFGNNFCIREAN